jgi:protein-tyrosine phosphatase
VERASKKTARILHFHALALTIIPQRRWFLRPVRILMVCMGNICRSPAAEAVLLSKAQQWGLEGQLVVDSAGTAGYHVGDSPDPRSQRALKQRGYNTTHLARQVRPSDLAEFDHLVVMDEINLRDLRRQIGPFDGGRARVSLLMEWWPAGGRPDVPDPYYGEQKDFELMMDLIEGACDALLRKVFGSEDPSSRPVAGSRGH